MHGNDERAPLVGARGQTKSQPLGWEPGLDEENETTLTECILFYARVRHSNESVGVNVDGDRSGN